MAETLSEIRRRAWQTRREKYGPRGNNGAYTRPCHCYCESMIALLILFVFSGQVPPVRASKTERNS
jgi:hypothetical protein